jgi:hypothetical protein
MLAWTLLLAGLVSAAPTPYGAPTLLPASALPGFTPYAWYASAGYCPPAETLTWSCGSACARFILDDRLLTRAQLTARATLASFRSQRVAMACSYSTVRGMMVCMDPYAEQRTGFVGYDPKFDSVVVSHQGTKPSVMYVCHFIATITAHPPPASRSLLTWMQSWRAPTPNSSRA